MEHFDFKPVSTELNAEDIVGAGPVIGFGAFTLSAKNFLIISYNLESNLGHRR